MAEKSKTKQTMVTHNRYCEIVGRLVPPSDIIPYLFSLRLWAVYDCVNHTVVSVGESYSNMSRLCHGHSYFCLVRFDPALSHLPR